MPHKVAYAQQYSLWHCPIGIAAYKFSQKSDKVGKYILSYIKGDDFIELSVCELSAAF